MLPSRTSLLLYLLLHLCVSIGQSHWIRSFRGCDNLTHWNAIVPPTSSLVSDVCNLMVEVEAEGELWLHLVLSFASNELDETDIALLREQKAPANSVILHSRQYSTEEVSGTDVILEDLSPIHLALPSNICGQMFLIATALAHQKSNFSSICWPFQVACETEADLSLMVEFPPNPPTSGLVQHNVTLVPGIPILQKLPGIRSFLTNVESSQSAFMGRTSPSIPDVIVYLSAQKHAPLFRSLPSYKRLDLHLGDLVLHTGNQLIDVLPGQSSSPLEVGQKMELSLQGLKLRTTAICGEAWMVFVLQLEDLDVENNFAILPVFIDCWASPELMGYDLGSCGVVPDETVMGKTAMIYTAGQPYGVGILRAFQYETEEKTFLPVTASSDRKLWTEIPGKFRSVQVEKDRLTKMDRCPAEGTELLIPFAATLFGHVHDLLRNVIGEWKPLEMDSQRHQQEKILVVAKAVMGLLAASRTYMSVPASFMDRLFTLLYTYWPFFPFGVSSPNSVHKSNNSSWHDRLSRTVANFMRQNLHVDNGGKGNPDQALQNFLNYLVWSPDVLANPFLPMEAIALLRQLLLMILEKQMPNAFDDLPSSVGQPLLNFSSQVMSPVPVSEDQVAETVERIYQAVQRSIPEDKFGKLRVVESLLETLRTSSMITKLTLIIRRIQESVLLNKQWILMNGMSDTSLDSELLCRLRALDQISFRSNPNIQRDSYVNKLHHTTFWKMDSGMIYRGDLSSITGRLYWNRIAVCYCDEETSVKPEKYQFKITDP